MTRSECCDCNQNASRMRNIIKRLKSALEICREDEKSVIFEMFCIRVLQISDELDRCQH